ncbi:Uncharacterised protein [Mycobacteroides abscessus subsp. abscessus]|nr:Uncharacterised protein [Mycobacteroides abscessus subsp. abscessus]
MQHVVYPEKDMGKRVAHLVRGSMQDYIEIEPGFALIKTTVPVKRAGQPWTYATETTVLERDDIILVTGPTQKAERFSQRD